MGDCMKRLLAAASICALLVAPPAFAADMAVKAPPPPVVSAPSWTGCHVGISGGGVWGRVPGYTTTPSSVILRVPPGFPQNTPAVGGFPLGNGFDLSGGIVGGNVGCDYQFGRWVFGAEGDWSWVGMTGSSVPTPALAVPTVGGGAFGYAAGDQWSASERWLATLRGRVGYAFNDKVMVYATGGAAWAKIDVTEFNAIVGATTAVSQSDTRLGWTVGLGANYAIDPHWIVMAEYLYVKIPTYTTFSPGAGPGYSTFGWATNLNTGMTNNIFRAGFSYKFGGLPQPVVAKY